ncbi:MAG: triose-phosphate isomerase [Rhodospirillaceae bacterium]|jgi:triosephosphate isomerase (TIM)|nr:triose-phosphate isomerase [Rhodospirillaceae bacterium]MBT5245422.1 triose-phosphate isomerase [Rhodospirillaceae bacterium]MBT5562578.1 triose-phosphate isomerase [Rhodospirillaceae bacterium]MBT6242564.1 triose-phosphate isomerase [Rhodospirillaceae bacterium]MBT7137213.1 triose-phosphate isomerase [Rhodospirillaceae bacterium]
MTAARRILIAGNWKMNGLQDDGVALARAVAGNLQTAGDIPFDMLVCPPYTLIGAVVAAASGTPLHVGAQDCHTAGQGAHTGDISCAMLADAGCSSIIVGHSERRADHGESDELVKAKAEAVNGAGLNAIICIGETEAERDAGETLNVVKSQIAGSVPDSATAANTVVAYEPVWAIGTGRTPTSDEVQEVHAFIRAELASKLGQDVADGVRLLYGGSMNPGNAEELLALADVDGGLIGGASLKPEDFWTIGESCP